MFKLKNIFKRDKDRSNAGSTTSLKSVPNKKHAHTSTSPLVSREHTPASSVRSGHESSGVDQKQERQVFHGSAPEALSSSEHHETVSAPDTKNELSKSLKSSKPSKSSNQKDTEKITFVLSDEQLHKQQQCQQNNLNSGDNSDRISGMSGISSSIHSLNSDYVDMDFDEEEDEDDDDDDDEEEEDGERKLVFESEDDDDDDHERSTGDVDSLRAGEIHALKEKKRQEKLQAAKSKNKKRQMAKYKQIQHMAQVQTLNYAPRKLFKEQEGLMDYLLLEKIGEGAFSKVYKAVKFDMNKIYSNTGDYQEQSSDSDSDSQSDSESELQSGFTAKNSTDKAPRQEFYAIKVIIKKMMEGEGTQQHETKDNEPKNSSKEQVLKEIMIHKLASQKRKFYSAGGINSRKSNNKILPTTHANAHKGMDFDSDENNGPAHIVEFVDFIETEQYYYMIQELLTGGEIFGEIVKYTYFSEDLSRFVIRQLAIAIKHLHSLGIVHRDIKPENLLFDRIPYQPRNSAADPPLKLRKSDDPNNKRDEGIFVPGVGGGTIGTVKLADFGLSKQIINILNNDTTKTPCGTVGYTAPEVVKDERYSFQVDMWGIGCVLYTVLCGFPPFYDDKIDVLTEKISKGQFTFLQPWWDEISLGAKNCVSKLLEVDPKKRYTIDDLFQDPWFMTYDCLENEKILHAQQMKTSNSNSSLQNSKARTSNRHKHSKKLHTKKKHLMSFDVGDSALYSPAAVAMRDAFDISNAVARQEEEFMEHGGSKSHAPNNQGNRTKKNTNNKGTASNLACLNEAEELDTSDYNTTITAPNTPDTSKIHENFFQLRLNSSTIVKRRNKNGLASGTSRGTAVSSPLKVEV